jgi:acyl transferase domain-containing protein
MDPQERLFLQSAWSALENAGYTRGALKGKFKRKVGVFAGITRAGYNLYRAVAGSEDRFVPRTSFSSVANRLSYFLDIHGPSLPVDTMCSSSLTAIHEACEHIHNGDCDLAFAGGVNLYLHPTSFTDMSSQHMLSKDGVLRSFGKGGNGFVPGEGAGVVLLKPLDRALEDHDVIHGVILATHVNHGGKTNGFTVPNPVAQAELVRSAIDKAGISARDISYIEAHGTGTELGDPIEISGLQQAFAQDTRETGYCKIGSVKPNVGHLEAAAGIAGLTKVLLQMKHRKIAPSLHSTALNPHIHFDKTPFEVNQALAVWERPVVGGKTTPRIAGISSFGAGGANAHVIVQEYEPTVRRSSAVRGKQSSVIIPLSAKSSEQLQRKAADLLDFLSVMGPDTPAQDTCALEEIAYTLQTGREAMDERLGFVVNSVEQLAESLDAFIRGKRDIEGAYRGQSQRNDEGLSMFTLDDDLGAAIDRWIARGKYTRLLELWVKGVDVDWNKLYGESKPRRIELPTYPFAQDEYWIDSGSLSRPAHAQGVNSRGAMDLRLLEDILDRIAADDIETARGVQWIKELV